MKRPDQAGEIGLSEEEEGDLRLQGPPRNPGRMEDPSALESLPSERVEAGSDTSDQRWRLALATPLLRLPPFIRSPLWSLQLLSLSLQTITLNLSE